MSKQNLYEEICNFYNWSFLYNKDGSIKEWSNDITNWTHSYISLDEALKGWLFTLEESNEDSQKQAHIDTWNEVEINFIKSLAVIK